MQRLHWFAVSVSSMTLLLLCAGALVTGTGSGLAVPDWPLSFGGFFPRMVGGVLFEHGHRLIAGSVALLTIALCFCLLRFEPRRWVRMLGVCAVLAVFAQAALGGLTVIFRLPRSVSVSHACLAQIFFSITIVISVVTSKSWSRPFILFEDARFPGLRHLALLLTVTFFCQLLLGAIMRHSGAGLAIPDFPTVYGGWIPPAFDFKIAIHYAHRIGALTAVALTTLFCMSVFKKIPGQIEITFWAGLLMATVAFQIMLGATVIWMRRPIPITTAHLAVGALCLAWSTVLTVQTFRRSRVVWNQRSLQLGVITKLK